MDRVQEEDYKRMYLEKLSEMSDLRDVVRSKDQTIAELQNRLKEMDIRSGTVLPNWMESMKLSKKIASTS